MITKSDINNYSGHAPLRGINYLYILPHPLLQPFISNYNISFPSPLSMPDGFRIMPSASSTLVYSFDGRRLMGALRGGNTCSGDIGTYANKFQLLVLVEFHPYGLFQMLKLHQKDFTNHNFIFDTITPQLDRKITMVIEQSKTIEMLRNGLDAIFLHQMEHLIIKPELKLSVDKIIETGGNISAHSLSESSYYSQNHLNRLFNESVGVGIKTFSRIVRINRALRLLRDDSLSLTEVAAATGFYDQSHFIREFYQLCQTTPTNYRTNMLNFYNETLKL